MATYSIKPELAKAFQTRFPNKASALVEDYIKNMLGSRLNDREVELDELREKCSAIENRINDLIADKLTYENKIELIERSITEQEFEQQERQSELEEQFRAECMDTNFYHKFKHKYIMSGAKDRRISEFEFYLELIEAQNEENN